MELNDFLETLADSLVRVDATSPVGRAGVYRPGVGPLTEAEALAFALKELQERDHRFAGAGPKRYEGGRSQCDLVIPGEWAIEFKIARPFGDNGKTAENWSVNLLHPYPGNVSVIGDCYKLLASSFAERKAVAVIGFEHEPPQVPLEQVIRAVEVIANDVCGIHLGNRVQITRTGLIHPVHQRLFLAAWEVLGSLT